MDVNPHSAPSLSKVMARSLPVEASPQIKSFHDAVALAVHAAMLGAGYRLVGLGEDHRIEPSTQSQSSKDTNPSNSDATVLPLPLEWNKGDDTHSFRYTHEQSAMQYLVKVSRLGKKAVVFGLGMGDDKTASFDVAAADFISESSLPATPLRKQQQENKSSNEDGKEGEEEVEQTTSIEEAARSVQDIFISAGRLSDLGSMIRLKLIQKLTPGIRKEGYEEDHPASTTTSNEPSGGNSSSRQPSNPQSYPNPYPHGPYDPSVEPPAARARPFPTGEMRPPGFEDEYDILRPAGRAPMMPPGGSPFGNVGERDLYPPGLGPRDPLRPHFGGGAGGGGMHPTFDDPMFGMGRGGGGGAGQGYDPQAPPGARYDPVGPGFGDGGPRDPRGGMGGGGGGEGRFPGGGGGGGPPNPFSGFGSGDFI